MPDSEEATGKHPVDHTLPPISKEWKANWAKGVKGRTLGTRERKSIKKTTKGCMDTTYTLVHCLDVFDVFQQTATVVIVKAEQTGTMGGGLSAGSVGGSIEAPYYVWDVVEYAVGINYHYELQVIETIVVTECIGQNPVETSSPGDPQWVLAGTNQNAAREVRVLISGIVNSGQAIDAANKQAPPGSGIERSYPAAGLEDRVPK
jgi:hypothetical protein